MADIVKNSDSIPAKKSHNLWGKVWNRQISHNLWDIWRAEADDYE